MSTFVVNLSAESTALVAKNGEQALELVEVADKAAFDATEPEAGQAIYLYDETPNLNTYCLEGEGFADTEITTGMSNRSVAKTSYNDGTQSVNLAFINEGDKDLYSGDDVVATFQLKAKVDTTVELDAATWTIGLLLDFTTGSTAASIDKSELQALVDAIKAEGPKAEDYTTATWTPFELALEDAERLLADEETTQETIDQCVKALQDAYDGLAKATVPPADGGDPSDKPSGDSGKDEQTGDQNAPSKDDNKPSASVDKNDGGQVPQTGDASVLLAAPAAVAGLALLTAGAGSLLASRKRHE